MHNQTLHQKKVAILSANGFETIELTSPKKALLEAGATVILISAEKTVKGWEHDHWTIELDTDILLSEAKTEDYDALLIPGGVINPDLMRRDKAYVSFVQEFLAAGKPVAAICHGPQLLIETGMIAGLEMTSFPSIKTDLINAGVNWVDKEVVADNGVITSRSPKDLPAFNAKIIEAFSLGIHQTRPAFTTAS